MAWTAARAWATVGLPHRLHRVARPWAAFTMVAIWLPYVLVAQLEGRLAAIDRSAVAVLNVVGGRKPRHYLLELVVMAVGIVGTCVVWAVPVSAMVLAVAAAGLVVEARWLVVLLWVPCVLMALYIGQKASTVGMVGRLASWWRPYRGQVLVSSLAAWPHRQGHAGRLLVVLGAALASTGRPTVINARTRQLAEVYQRWADSYPGWQVTVLDAGKPVDSHRPAS